MRKKEMPDNIKEINEDYTDLLEYLPSGPDATKSQVGYTQAGSVDELGIKKRSSDNTFTLAHQKLYHQVRVRIVCKV